MQWINAMEDINYITETAGCRCRAVASSCLLVACTSTSEQARVRSKLVPWLPMYFNVNQ